MPTSIRSIDSSDPEYPLAFSAVDRPPPRVWIAGSLPIGATRVAIVGTRRADREAIAFTTRLAAELAARGAVIVSGGADGIDAAAHLGALDADGATIVVMPTALHRPYPPQRRATFDAILERGGWISECGPEAPIHRGRFLARNRLIAALAASVVVVQAPLKSGAISTARFAQKLGRPLFTVPAAPWDPRGTGCLALLAEGARLCVDADDLLPSRRTSARPTAPILELSGDLRGVYEALGARPQHPDAIAASTSLPIAKVHVALIALATRGLARQESGGWQRTAR